MSRREENAVADESLVVIWDPEYSDRLLLGAVRMVVRYEPFLKERVRSVYVDFPDALDEEAVMPFSNAYVEIYGALVAGEEGGAIVENNVAPHPGSKVYLVEHGDRLSRFIHVRNPVVVGSHKYSGWEVPLASEFATYHIGIFGATGMGKSRLARALINELVNAGYAVIVFDHTGVDYAPYYPEDSVLPSTAIRISPPVIASALIALTGLRDWPYRDYLDIACAFYDSNSALRRFAFMEARKRRATAGGEEKTTVVLGPCKVSLRVGMSYSTPRGGAAAHRRRTLFEEVDYEELAAENPSEEGSGDEGGEPGWDKEAFKCVLGAVMQQLKAQEQTIWRAQLYIDYYVPSEFFSMLNRRRLRPEDVVRMALKKRLVVVDLSYDRDLAVKQAIVRDVIDAAWRVLSEEQGARGRGLVRLNLGFFVDEAQNYASESGAEMSRAALERVAREGRKWGLFIAVASQRVARDIASGIRANLGTVFFSRLQSTGDLREIAGYVDLGTLSEYVLGQLAQREFFVAGLMNPLRKPLLLRVREVAG